MLPLLTYDARLVGDEDLMAAVVRAYIVCPFRTYNKRSSSVIEAQALILRGLLALWRIRVTGSR